MRRCQGLQAWRKGRGVRDPRRSQAESAGNPPPSLPVGRTRGTQKPNSKARYWRGNVRFRKRLRPVTTAILVRQEQCTGLSVSTTASLHVTQTISQQLPGLKSSGPTCPGLAHWPPKTQNNELLLEKKVLISAHMEEETKLPKVLLLMLPEQQLV